ncbi:MAG: hypothetical protein HC919_01150 [Oscillatoriales cyanobacterium SM2_2_1]|nr:hypothetical protein [Oscillatoriales cyanobacterium SM2_2_1]
MGWMAWFLAWASALWLAVQPNHSGLALGSWLPLLLLVGLGLWGKRRDSK